MQPTNKCMNGYCSRFVDSADISQCHSLARPDWDGRCGFQNGNPVFEEIETPSSPNCGVDESQAWEVG